MPKTGVEMRFFQCCALAAVVLSPTLALAQRRMQSDQEMQRSNEAYRVGTDVAMMYLAQHAGTLRVTLLLQECDMPDLASAVGAGLPNSIAFFFANSSPAGLPEGVKAFAAQITRGYLLGFEAAVRTEFARQWKGADKQSACGAIANIAATMLPKR